MQTKYGVNKPYDEGHKAGSAGKEKEDNPHQPGTSDHRNWSEGHSDGSKQQKDSKPQGG